MLEAKDGFVLDCSVTMSWCFEDETDAYADSVQDALTSVRAVVPTIWPLEVANALIVGERRKRLDEARSTRFFAMLSGLPIVVDDETAGRGRQKKTPRGGRRRHPGTRERQKKRQKKTPRNRSHDAC